MGNVTLRPRFASRDWNKRIRKSEAKPIWKEAHLEKADPKNGRVFRRTLMGGELVRPREVITELKERRGLEIHRNTLLDYKKRGLIPKPEEKSGGRGRGKIVDYPEETPAEFWASFIQVNVLKLKRDTVTRVRRLALRWQPFAKLPPDLYKWLDVAILRECQNQRGGDDSEGVDLDPMIKECVPELNTSLAFLLSIKWLWEKEKFINGKDEIADRINQILADMFEAQGSEE